MRIVIAVLLLLALGGIMYVFFGGLLQSENPKEKNEIIQTKGETRMEISSPAFGNNQTIPPKYTCDGDDMSPPLAFSAVPKDAKSLALIVDDPDAPSKVFTHWVVFNIDPTISSVEENDTPKGGTLGTTDFGANRYGGPCPPSGTHRYFFRLYALDTTLPLPEGSEKQQVLDGIEGHVLEKAELIGLYIRK